MLANRRIPVWLVTFSIIGTVISSVSFVALPGAALLRTVDLGFTLLLTAVAIEVITGWDIRLVIAGIGVFTLLYTFAGGIEAVVWNDVPQGLILATGAICVLLMVLLKPEGGPGLVVATAWRGGRFELGDFSLTWQSLFAERPTGWLLMLSGLFHFGRAYATEQNMVQRYLVARTDREAQRATLTGALLCLVIWLTFTFIGTGSR